jgi:hypothetical protein
MIVELFSVANKKEQAKLVKRQQWKKHRNKGFRRLTSFASNTSTHPLPRMPTRAKTAKTIS